MADFYKRKIEWLDNRFTGIAPLEYYRMIFNEGSFQKKCESNGDYKPNGLLQYRNRNDKKSVMRNRIINDDLNIIQQCIDREGCFLNHEFVVISGCSYIGKNKKNTNARYCHAIIFDIDEVDVPELEKLFQMISDGILPRPTALSVSGNGVHLTYILDKPLPLYGKKLEMLNNLKAVLTRLLWCSYTSQDPNIQYQGIVQGYRVVGTKTKKGHTVKAYLTGKIVSLDYLIGFVDDFDSVAMLKPTRKGQGYLSAKLKKLKKDNKLSWHLLEELTEDELRYTLDEAKEKWPEWYQRRVIDNQMPGHWHNNKCLYNWWLNKIRTEAHPGIRMKSILVLGAYAQKCDIPEDEFVWDAYSLVDIFEAMTTDEKNHFTTDDVEAAIRMYHEKDLTKMSVAGIQRMTGLEMHRERETALARNDRLKKSRQIRDLNYTDGKHWYDGGGRPDKSDVVRSYLSEHPDEKNVSLIARECGVARNTVYKYLIS
ncbi:MAG: hypothetical protein IJJ61_06455 [Clostridia bacterium]|nr:hypothetical protein [Clostridia bacterium]